MSNHLFVTAEIKAYEYHNLDEVKAELKRLGEETLKEPDCFQFSIHQCKDDPHCFLLWEEFASEESLEQHFKEPHTLEYLKKELTEIVRAYKTHRFVG